jgi:hypothetical protein
VLTGAESNNMRDELSKDRTSPKLMAGLVIFTPSYWLFWWHCVPHFKKEPGKSPFWLAKSNWCLVKSSPMNVAHPMMNKTIPIFIRNWFYKPSITGLVEGEIYCKPRFPPNIGVSGFPDFFCRKPIWLKDRRFIIGFPTLTMDNHNFS